MSPPRVAEEETIAGIAATTREALEARRSRLRELAHELRGPLAAIQNYCEILLDHPPTDEDQRRLFLTTVADEAARLSRLLDDLIAIERLETAQLATDPVRCDLVFATERALLALHPLASAKKIAIESELLSPDGAVFADPLLLERAIYLIAENAVRFSHEGAEVRIRIGDRDGRALVAIEDDGIGVPEEQYEPIFAKFYKAAIPPDGVSPQGSGVGLTLARAIARTYDGDVVCVGKEQGARFELSLPLR